MEVVAMLRLVGEKTRQQRQTKRRSSETPIAQANEWGGRWGNKEGDKAAAADKTPITADKRGDKKEGRKERKKEGQGREHIHDEVTRGFHSEGLPWWHGF